MIYEKLGNIPEIYVHKEREVLPAGLVTNQDLILKLYDMHTKGKPAHQESLIERCRNFLNVEIKNGKLEPQIGLGFAILSNDMINVARWDKFCPIVLHNQIYEYSGNLDDITKLDIHKEGPFCIWELGIVNHERNAWRRYLESSMKESDKIQYIESFISEPL